MWVLKAKIFHPDSKAIQFAQKFQIELWGVPISVYKKKGKLLISIWHQIFGSEENVKKFFKAIKTDKRLFDVEIKGNTVYYSYLVKKTGSHYAVYTNPAIVFVKPAVVTPDGMEIIEFGSFSKKVLMEAIDLMKESIEVTVLKLSQQKAPNIFIPHVMPELSEKQKECLETAYVMGYYSFPRRVTLEEIAKKIGLSYSTLQEHLRKAEEKVMPYFLENYAKHTG